MLPHDTLPNHHSNTFQNFTLIKIIKPSGSDYIRLIQVSTALLHLGTTRERNWVWHGLSSFIHSSLKELLQRHSRSQVFFPRFTGRARGVLQSRGCSLILSRILQPPLLNCRVGEEKFWIGCWGRHCDLRCGLGSVVVSVQFFGRWWSAVDGEALFRDERNRNKPRRRWMRLLRYERNTPRKPSL